MNAQTIGWLLILAVIKNFSSANINPFKLADTNLTAIEGSCVEIKCKVNRVLTHAGAYWFWIKNATWIESTKKFDGTIIYSTNHAERPVSLDFANKVRYIGSPYSELFTLPGTSNCSILICNLSKTDSGNYSFRYVGPDTYKWRTDDMNLTVAENPCPLTFEKPPVVKESGKIALTCSTLSSCPSYPLIQDLKGPDTKEYTPVGEGKNSTTASITVSWQDDGKEFSCQTHDNKDSYLIQNVSVTVEYAPKDITVEMISGPIREGEPVNLNCSAKGRPEPTFVWFRKWNNTKEEVFSGAEWRIQAINDSQSGEYLCQAKNTYSEVVESEPVTINVTYKPEVEVKMTLPAPSSTRAVVKERDKMTLTCNVRRSSPQPRSYVWSNGGKEIGKEKTHTVNSVAPEDSGTYECRATNDVGTGTSQFQIEVEYSPRKTNITKTTNQVKVNQPLTFYCNTHANPQPERYSWYRYSKDKQTDSSLLWKSNSTESNQLHLERVQRADEACYTCNATNRIDTGDNSQPMCIRVLYRPKNVKVKADPDFVVNENTSLTLSCHAESFPSVTSVTWMKMTNGKSEIIKDWNITFNASASDSGQYSCEASNEIGTGKSQQDDVKVKYAPKHTEIIIGAEQQQADGRSSVSLTCSSHSYPEATYTWHKKTTKVNFMVSKQQNLRVYSDEPGLYYCIAKNEINQRSSEPVKLFVNRGLLMALKICIPFLMILLIVLIVLVYRHKRNKSHHQGKKSTLPSSALLGWWNGTRRRDQMNELVMAEPFRSRDDLLPDQPCRPNGHRRQPRPDSTSAANISSVYYTVNLPAGKQGPSAQKPIRQQGGHTEDCSLNYSSLHFGNEPKNKHAKGEQDVVYAMVSKQNPPKKREQGGLEDYENVSTIHAAKSPDPLSYESDSSSDEEELSYTQVNFVAKPGHERSSSDSTSSDEDRTQYSEVKL
ncbi:hypothetical protein L3Q82_002441 [Scortum barcoo]|uniref:Uncharacterized protein n=1 Tax=Scortum barcoo TaxID=214431 RepID=A0ACB8VYB3_9TELE|nr:hypothetical protein L3Q82_002441 [Scortum barcoo]